MIEPPGMSGYEGLLIVVLFIGAIVAACLWGSSYYERRDFDDRRHRDLAHYEPVQCRKCGERLLSCHGSMDHYNAMKPNQQYWCTHCMAHRYPATPADWKA